MTPNVIDWRITENCNQNCLFCYATDYVDGEINFNSVNDVIIIDKILDIGCESVCISGGEPLLDDDGERAFRIIKALKENDVNVFLSTNGTNFLRLEEKYGISKYLSKLSLPLDGYDEESSLKNGHVGTFKYVKEILDHFNHIYHRGYNIPKIKVSTVVTRNNINDNEYWENLCKFINSYPIIKLWKIYDFVPENRGKINKDKLSYVADEFNVFSLTMNKLGKQFSVPIEKVRRNSRSQIYFIIRPDGSVIIPKDNYDETDELVIGNLLRDSVEQIITKWTANIKSERCTLYFNGRTLPDEAHYHEDIITRTILEEIAKEENKNNPYSIEDIFSDVSRSLNENEQKVRNTFLSLTFGNNPIIKEVIPVINLSELGLHDFLITLVFNDSAGFTAERIASIICSNPSVGWCAHYNVLNTGDADNESALNGKIVFRISIFASSIRECNRQLDVIIEPVRTAYLSKSTDYVPEQYVAFDKTLNPDDESLDGRHVKDDVQQGIKLAKEELKLSRQEETALVAMSSFCNTNKLCFENLLTELQSGNASHDWRGKNISSQLKNVIDSLRDKKIINMFQLVTNDKMRGYETFLVIYDLHPIHGEGEQELLSNFKNFVESISCGAHYNVLDLGDWDIDVEIRVKTKGEFTQIISQIDEKFGDEIRKKQYMELVKEYRFTFLIPVVVDAIKKVGTK